MGVREHRPLAVHAVVETSTATQHHWAFIGSKLAPRCGTLGAPRAASGSVRGNACGAGRAVALQTATSMRHTSRIITLTLALAPGCLAETGTPTDAKPAGTPASKLDKAKQETKEAAEAVRDYGYAEKAEFVAEMKKQLAEIQTELDRLSAEVEASKGEAKADAKARLEAVRVKWTAAKQRLDAAEKATDTEWDAVKGEVKQSYGELKESVDDTRRWLSEEIAPS